MTDDQAIKYAVPAIGLGYKVSNDEKGKLLFENSYCSIRYLNNAWILTDLNNDIFEYHDLKTALLDGAT